MARRPTLSPTRISNYLACPTKYRWTYLDARGRYFLRAKSYFSFGTSLHRVLEKFHDSGEQGVTTVQEAVAALEDNWIDAGYESQQEMEEALGEGRMLIAAHVMRQTRLERPAKTLFVEKRLRADCGDFDLVGQVDRLDEHEDGTLEIVDYKSGRDSVTSDEIKNDLAMSCYQWLVRQEYPGRPVKATILALQTGEEASYGMSDSELAEFEADLRFIGAEIVHREWEYVVPNWKNLCTRCEFLPLCRKYEEFNSPE